MEPKPWARRAARSAYVDHLRAMRVSDRVIAAALRDAAIDAEKQIAQLLARGNIGSVVRASQLQNLTLYLRENQAGLWGNVTRATRDGIVRGARAAADGNLSLVNYLTRAGADVGLLRNQFELAARHSVESVRGKYLNDIDLSPRVYRNQQVGISRAQRVVTRGLAQNQSSREIAKNVAHLINPSTPGGVSYAANRLARTEINNAFHATSTRWYDRTPFVEAVKWEISGSHPRPDECDELADDDHEGLGPGIFLPENVPDKPHPNCLCSTYPVTPDADEFVRNLRGGNYDEWIASEGF